MGLLYVFQEVITKLKLTYFREAFRRRYKNQVLPMNVFPVGSIKSIGMSTYGELNVITFDRKSKLSIGNYVSIAQNVRFLLDVEHHLNHISTYPFKAKVLNQPPESFSKGDIVIEDDVWIGFGATIMSGVTIGQGAVIAAGAIVTKDVEPYSIVGGIPSKMIKYRFNEEIRKYLLTLDFSNLTNDMIKHHEDDLYREIESMTLKEVEQVFAWFPKRY